MDKKDILSVFIKRLSWVLAVFFLVIIFSCKSAAPSNEETAAEEIEGPVLTEEAESPAAVEEPQTFPPITPPEEATEGDSAEGKPDTTIPPETPVEEQPALPVPQPPAFPPPQAEIRETLPEPEFQASEIPAAPEPIEPPEPPQPVLPPEPRPAAPVPEPPLPVLPIEPSPAAPEPTPTLPVPPTPPAPSVPPVPVAPPAPPRERTEPPPPPPFLRPAEPERTPPAQEPAPVNPLPELPSGPLPESAAVDKIIFSRVVRATVGQLIEIPFRGTGWVYLGELGNRRGISYESRRLDLNRGVTEGQSFIFRAELTGTYILKFYRQDFIQDYIINDHVQVIVGDDPEYPGMGRPIEPGRVIAEPRWPPASPSPAEPEQDQSPPAETQDLSPAAIPAPAPAQPAPEPSAAAPATPAAPAAEPVPESVTVVPRPPAASTTPEPAASEMRGSSPEEYVRRAKEEFDASSVEAALATLDAMQQLYPLGTDEALWLYGQLLEANSPARDIRLALEYYRRLVREYPQSRRVPDAQRRIAYLERYYFNIR